MSDDEKYVDDVYYAEQWEEYNKSNIDDISFKITEWIWKEEELVLGETWHSLTFDQVNKKIWDLIIKERN